MTVEVIIPSVRTCTVSKLIASLAFGDIQPDVITVVSNEARVIANPTTALLRVLRFHSDQYMYGFRDVALRRNIGLFHSDADIVIFQDDDQVASAGMVRSTIDLLGEQQYAWGHHRYLDFGRRAVSEIASLPPEAGRSREAWAPGAHGYQSCYAGMLTARREFLLDMGGFDMLFLGRHAGEDQNLGYRMLQREGKDRVWIHEPPFAWHPIRDIPYAAKPRTNLCSDHEIEKTPLHGFAFEVCLKCPWKVPFAPEQSFFTNKVIVPYDHGTVAITEEVIA